MFVYGLDTPFSFDRLFKYKRILAFSLRLLLAWGSPQVTKIIFVTFLLLNGPCVLCSLRNLQHIQTLRSMCLEVLALTLMVLRGGGGKIGHATQNLAKSARVLTIITPLKTNIPV